MKIILDAMGGDFAPRATILGAVQAVKELDVQIVLVGRGDLILSELQRVGYSTIPAGMEILDAPDVVDMHDAPETVIKQRRDSSMIVGLHACRGPGRCLYFSRFHRCALNGCHVDCKTYSWRSTGGAVSNNSKRGWTVCAD